MTDRPRTSRTRSAGTAPHWLLAALLAGFVGAAGGADPAGSSGSASTPGAAPTRSVAQVVAGILGYTRWPGDAPAVRLCTLGQGAAVDELLRSADLKAGQRIVSVRAAAALAQPWRSCDAMYLGDMETEASRTLLQELVGRPVLVLGEGTTFCSDGGMFCLEPRSPSVRFHANLDAIARSGLRVNPLVLRIARAHGGGS